MKAYELTNPPQRAGIYLLRNKVSGLLYVGKSKNLYRRYSEWKMVFTQRLGVKSLKLLEAAADSDPADWEFCIVMEFEQVDDHTLADFEQQTIKRFDDEAPGFLLNSHIKRTAGNIVTGSRSVILDKGEPITYGQAARVLDCTTKQVQKRMARYRKRGIYEIELADLIALSQKFRYVPEAKPSAPKLHYNTTKPLQNKK